MTKTKEDLLAEKEIKQTEKLIASVDKLSKRMEADAKKDAKGNFSWSKAIGQGLGGIKEKLSSQFSLKGIAGLAGIGPDSILGQVLDARDEHKTAKKVAEHEETVRAKKYQDAYKDSREGKKQRAELEASGTTGPELEKIMNESGIHAYQDWKKQKQAEKEAREKEATLSDFGLTTEQETPQEKRERLAAEKKEAAKAKKEGKNSTVASAPTANEADMSTIMATAVPARGYIPPVNADSSTNITNNTVTGTAEPKARVENLAKAMMGAHGADITNNYDSNFVGPMQPGKLEQAHGEVLSSAKEGMVSELEKATNEELEVLEKIYSVLAEDKEASEEAKLEEKKPENPKEKKEKKKEEKKEEVQTNMFAGLTDIFKEFSGLSGVFKSLAGLGPILSSLSAVAAPLAIAAAPLAIMLAVVKSLAPNEQGGNTEGQTAALKKIHEVSGFKPVTMDSSAEDRINSQGSTFMGIESSEFKAYKKKYADSVALGTEYSPEEAKAIEKKFGIKVRVKSASIEKPEVTSTGTQISQLEQNTNTNQDLSESKQISTAMVSAPTNIVNNSTTNNKTVQASPPVRSIEPTFLRRLEDNYA